MQTMSICSAHKKDYTPWPGESQCLPLVEFYWGWEIKQSMSTIMAAKYKRRVCYAK